MLCLFLLYSKATHIYILFLILSFIMFYPKRTVTLAVLGDVDFVYVGVREVLSGNKGTNWETSLAKTGGWQWKEVGGVTWKEVGGVTWKEVGGVSWREVGGVTWKEVGGVTWKEVGGVTWKEVGGVTWFGGGTFTEIRT